MRPRPVNGQPFRAMEAILILERISVVQKVLGAQLTRFPKVPTPECFEPIPGSAPVGEVSPKWKFVCT